MMQIASACFSARVHVLLQHFPRVLRLLVVAKFAEHLQHSCGFCWACSAQAISICMCTRCRTM
jgi:hypothetical protein